MKKDLIKYVKTLKSLARNGGLDVKNFLDSLEDISKKRQVEASVKKDFLGNIPEKYKNQAFYSVISSNYEDYVIAMGDMLAPDQFTAVLELINEKLVKEGESKFDMNTPENKILGLANRYAKDAKDAIMVRKWNLLAFYLRSLAYFVPILLEKANISEKKIYKELNFKLESAFGNPDIRVGMPADKLVAEEGNPLDIIKIDVPTFIRLLEFAREDSSSDLDLHFITENALDILNSGVEVIGMKNYQDLIKFQGETLAEGFDNITDNSKKEQYDRIKEAKKDLEKKSDYELLDMYYHGNVPKGTKANKEKLIYGILQDRFGDEVKYFYKEPESKA